MYPWQHWNCFPRFAQRNLRILSGIGCRWNSDLHFKNFFSATFFLSTFPFIFYNAFFWFYTIQSYGVCVVWTFYRNSFIVNILKCCIKLRRFCCYHNVSAAKLLSENFNSLDKWCKSYEEILQIWKIKSFIWHCDCC